MEKSGICVFEIKAMRMPGFLSFLSLLLLSCNPQEASPPLRQPATAIRSVGDIPLPAGYQRVPADNYTRFLRGIPLKKDPTVYLYNGLKKGNQEAQYAVLNIDVGNKDLQQCADAVMRLRAEYLYAQQQYDSIRFRFTNSFYCDYTHYARGYRLKISGNTCTWVRQAAENHDYATFRQYLELVYAYAGTQSLSAQLRPLPFHNMRPGSVFLQTREPYGHAVTVMDMAYNPGTKDTIFLLSQSYMPAQDIHILRNPGNKTLSPWYSVRFSGPLETPEWTFFQKDLRTF